MTVRKALIFRPVEDGSQDTVYVISAIKILVRLKLKTTQINVKFMYIYISKKDTYHA